MGRSVIDPDLLAIRNLVSAAVVGADSVIDPDLLAIRNSGFDYDRAIRSVIDPDLLAIRNRRVQGSLGRGV